LSKADVSEVLRNFEPKKNQIFLCMLLKNWKSDIVMLALFRELVQSKEQKFPFVFISLPGYTSGKTFFEGGSTF
jgi:hypothetical protein